MTFKEALESFVFDSFVKYLEPLINTKELNLSYQKFFEWKDIFINIPFLFEELKQQLKEIKESNLKFKPHLKTNLMN